MRGAYDPNKPWVDHSKDRIGGNDDHDDCYWFLTLLSTARSWCTN